MKKIDLQYINYNAVRCAIGHTRHLRFLLWNLPLQYCSGLVFCIAGCLICACV